MFSTSLLIGAFSTALIGFGLLALSQVRYGRRHAFLASLSLRQRVLLRGLGSLAIVFSLALALLRDGPAFGALLWLFLISTAAVTVSLLLSE